MDNTTEILVQGALRNVTAASTPFVAMLLLPQTFVLTMGYLEAVTIISFNKAGLQQPA